MSDETPEVEDQQEAPEAPEVETPDEPDEDTPEEWDPKRAKSKIAKLNREAAGLRQKAQEGEKVPELSEKVTALEAQNLRLEVALDLGLPMAVAKRLNGTTREEIQQDAEELLGMLAPSPKPVSQKPTVRLSGGGAPDAEPEETDLEKIGARMMRR
jgi:hypothetical protein